MMVLVITTCCENAVRYTFDFILSALSCDICLEFATPEEFRASKIAYDVIISYGERIDESVDYIYIPMSEQKGIVGECDTDYKKFSTTGTLELQFSNDIIRYVFERISCKLEYELEKQDRSIHSLSANFENCPYNFKEPSVDRAIQSLGRAINEVLPKSGDKRLTPPYSRYPDNKPFAICLTHDVDTTAKTFKMLLKQTRHFLYRSSRFIGEGDFGGLRGEFKTLVAKYLSNLDYWQFPKIFEIEKRLGVNATYNFFVRTEKNMQGLQQMLYNPEYDLENDQIMKDLIREILALGSEVGLHGSYCSSDSRELLDEEKEKLADIAGRDIAGTRQHFLQYSQQHTPVIHKNIGLKYDSSVGFRDMNGFRAGTCKPFYQFDHDNGLKIDVLEIPLIIMDSALFDREFVSYEDAWQDIETLLKLVKDYNGTCSILWHNHVFNNTVFPAWGKIYEDIIFWVKENDGWAGSCAEFYDSFRPKKSGCRLR